MDLRDRLAEAARGHGVPGAAVAVWHDGELHEAATGVLNTVTGVEATTDSVFQVGSTTKVWTAALVMQLVADGLVKLDKPVGTYLPDFAFGGVTVRQLLSHTAGFDGDVFEDTGRGDDCLEKFLGHLGTAGRVHEPGELFSYCNAGYCVLGALVARLRGGTWEQAVRERLLDPLGATQAALFGEEAALFRVSAGHIGPDATVYPRWQMPRSNGPAGATMCLAPRELVAFGRTLAAGGLAPNGKRLLPEESVAAMLTPQVHVPGGGGALAERWGLGVELFGWGAYGHDGGTPGQSTYWRIVPEADFVLAMSGNGGSFAGLIADVARPVIEEATGLTVPGPPLPPQVLEPVDGAPYAGSYQGPQLGYEVAAAEDGLDVTLIPGPLMESMGATRSTTRYARLDGESFIAVEAEDGRHDVVTFVLRDGRAAYLHNGRAVARV
ncbi:serine hydrolase domain-containing protein [Nonomuraea jiangxiensis]|uniref:CubicO group peptidase, beta-lactamase class C family n=1 Tax=Nonomuraea jiangxiensis TaxID=633440 RepID=A0A1G9C5T9_9ACTN|nr:serine hydrolase domain-containing protein [Nonomuraea jiangxiensis]SDK47026.1 CubicO group peptidase, beta-lactamase class C family [Nonomuraea jiangxiensis]